MISAFVECRSTLKVSCSLEVGFLCDPLRPPRLNYPLLNLGAKVPDLRPMTIVSLLVARCHAKRDDLHFQQRF